VCVENPLHMHIKKISLVIGKKGTTKETLQAETMCKIVIKTTKNNNNLASCTITGKPDQIT
jgi:rRNA processing protein Krr1/Pno1